MKCNVDRYKQTVFVEETMAQTTNYLQRTAAHGKTIGTIDFVGFLSMGVTLLFFSLHQARVIEIGDSGLTTILFAGGIGQILAGLTAMRVKHLFGSITFTAFGFFWLSVIALFIVPEFGVAESPQSVALSSYSVMWGLFAGMIYLGAMHISLQTRLLFAMLSLNFAILSFGQATLTEHAVLFGGLFGGACGTLFIVHALCHGAIGLKKAIS